MIYEFHDRPYDLERFSILEFEWDRELYADAWMRLLENVPAGGLDDRDNPVAFLRREAELRYGTGSPSRPMVFLSHSHKDRHEAVHLAQRIDASCPKFDVWLDEWDPVLKSVGQFRYPAQARAWLIALAVEMGLLYSSHLVALQTSRSVGSAWIPYEYGRIKPDSIFSVYNAALVKQTDPPFYEPEYLLLGRRFTTAREVIGWLQ